MEALVTGGAGFLGTHLVKRLLKDGHTVHVLDNLQTGSLHNLQPLIQEFGDRIKYQQHDVLQPFPEFGNLDQIFHLACPASPIHYQKDELNTLKVNVIGTLNAIECAKNSGARLLITSTSEVYGDPLESPQKETYRGNVSTTGIRAAYDVGKMGAEAAVAAATRQQGIQGRIVRIFNTYGPGMSPKDGRVIPNFIQAALKGEPLEIYGDGSQTRSLCFADDMVEGLLKAAASDHPEPINLGNPDERTIKELALLIIKLTDSKSKLVEKPLPQDDPKQRCPNITRAKEILGWQPRISLEEGLRATIPYFEALQTRV
ncbi:NAD-dependent dehydratase [Candidatus Woesearchaeota archaeon]|nr:NAD-dependent dehydratase [Candidatus Woesearchaeota archaeon]